KTLLAPLAAADQAGPYDSLMSQAFLARAERALGNEAAARQFANAAHAIAEAISATPRVMAMLARHETEMQSVKLRLHGYPIPLLNQIAEPMPDSSSRPHKQQQRLFMTQAAERTCTTECPLLGSLRKRLGARLCEIGCT